jgi:hypothetical protein
MFTTTWVLPTRPARGGLHIAGPAHAMLLITVDARSSRLDCIAQRFDGSTGETPGRVLDYAAGCIISFLVNNHR